MSVVSSVTVKVPGTTANLGPGFDCIGAALTIPVHPPGRKWVNYSSHRRGSGTRTNR